MTGVRSADFRISLNFSLLAWPVAAINGVEAITPAPIPMFFKNDLRLVLIIYILILIYKIKKLPPNLLNNLKCLV
jgi:hypothetical protein